jgi:carbamoyltransferase
MNIVGISGGLGHDSAACLVQDGQLVAAAEEERFVRRKNAPRLPPVHSLLYCLSAGNIDLSDIDYVAFSWDPAKDPETFRGRDLARDLLRHPAIHERHRADPVYIDHHLSHAASSFYSSGLADAGVLVADGRGETAGTTLFAGRDRSLKPILSFGVHHSLGFFYESASFYVGLGDALDGPGKLMGLAAYGSPVHDLPEIEITTEGYQLPVIPPRSLGDPGARDDIVAQWLKFFDRRFSHRVRRELALDRLHGRLRDWSKVFSTSSADIAASVQSALERVLMHLADMACKEARSGNLVLAGGVALNCSANGLLRSSGHFDDLYVFPAAGDAGGAVGAAFEVAARCGEPAPSPIAHAYWGPDYDYASFAGLLRGYGIPFEEPDEIWSAAGRLLLDDKIGGWFRGRAEFGPRALGHRSIIASPASKPLADEVNRCKGREPWRPLAPSMSLATATKALGLDHDSPYMLEAAQVSDGWATALEGVVHIDGSTRPHTVGPWTDLAYQNLIGWLERATGVGAVLNTSFNVAGEPIVCTPGDAIRSFYTSSLDFLILGPMLLRKAGTTAAYGH